ncbi:hypothetical protein ACH5RR_035450 [Cinchona calisaya]|uniref:Uncharacterized protein n=1 Tax=Cinchona calisaya TaxID=153742 RepID=A0ABD2Y1U1_9GENT
MDKDDLRRNHYACMPQNQKDKLLHRRNKRYAEMPQDKKEELLRHRREFYAHTKKEKQNSDGYPVLQACRGKSKDIDKKKIDENLIEMFDAKSRELGSYLRVRQNQKQSSNSIPLSLGALNQTKGWTLEESFSSVKFSMPQLSKENATCHALINVKLVNKGEVSIAIPAMPYDLSRLYTSLDEESVEFRRNSRTYNNSLGFTSLGAKCRFDIDLEDADGTITASVFVELGEKLLGYNVVQTMKYFKQDGRDCKAEPPLGHQSGGVLGGKGGGEGEVSGGTWDGSIEAEGQKRKGRMGREKCGVVEF